MAKRRVKLPPTRAKRTGYGYNKTCQCCKTDRTPLHEYRFSEEHIDSDETGCFCSRACAREIFVGTPKLAPRFPKGAKIEKLRRLY